MSIQNSDFRNVVDGFVSNRDHTIKVYKRSRAAFTAERFSSMVLACVPDTIAHDTEVQAGVFYAGEITDAIVIQLSDGEDAHTLYHHFQDIVNKNI